MARLIGFVNRLQERNITDPEQVATELLRVKVTQKKVESQLGPAETPDEEILYRIMKEETETQLGYFPGDQTWFAELFAAGRKLSLAAELEQLFQKDRSGVVISPRYLVDYFSRVLSAGHIESVLIPEAHKHLRGLTELIAAHPEKRFVLTAEKKWLAVLLEYLFSKEENVEVLHLSLYSHLELEDAFDMVIAFPTPGLKLEVDPTFFFTRTSEGVAVQNLLSWLSEFGELQIIVPARFTFSGGAFARLRDWIIKDFFVKALYALPEGSLRPYTGVRTYLLILTQQPVEEVQVGHFALRPPHFKPIVEKTLPVEVMAERDDWRLELLLQDRHQEILDAFAGTGRRIVKLKEIADLFRGKSIMKSHLQPGDIFVLNISSIEEGEILWEGMDTINEEYRKVQRYALTEGDVVITCRGTVNKVAVVRDLPQKTIASANIIVIRVKEQSVLSEYIHIFLESPVGTQLVQSFQRGTTVMNINPSDLGELEIPLLEMEEQEKIVEEYRAEQDLYQKTVTQARERWERIRQDIYKRLTE